MPRSPSPTARVRKVAGLGLAVSPRRASVNQPVPGTSSSSMVPLAEVAAANKPYLLIFDSIIAWWFTFISIPVWLPAYCAMALTAAVTKVWRYLRPMKKAATPSSQINGRISMIQANGLTTEILQWEPRSSDATTLVMVPGNPGAAEYYGPFLEEVHRLSGHTLRILCVGHPSHSARTADVNGRAVLNLKDQVAHKNAVLAMLLQQYPGSPFVLAGHSIGAHLCVEAAHALPHAHAQARVQRIIGLFPTLLNIGDSDNGQKMMPMFKYCRQALWCAAHLVRAWPAALQRALVSVNLPAGITPRAHHIGVTVTNLIHPYVGYNALHMAMHEMLELRDLDEARFLSLASKVRLFFAQRDGWVRDEDRKRLMTLTAHSTIATDAGDVHGFVLHEESYKRVAKYVWGVLLEASQAGDRPL